MQHLRASSNHIGCVTGPPWDQCLCLEHRIFWMLVGLHWGVLLWSWEGIQFPWRKDLGTLTRKGKIFAAGRCTTMPNLLKCTFSNLGSGYWTQVLDLTSQDLLLSYLASPRILFLWNYTEKKIKEDSWLSSWLWVQCEVLLCVLDALTSLLWLMVP